MTTVSIGFMAIAGIVILAVAVGIFFSGRD